MTRLFNSLVRVGVTSETPQFRKEEIKLMNSIGVHSILFSLCSAALGCWFLSDHAYFILAVAMTEVIAKSCVLLLHFVQRYTPAKIIFTMVTLVAFLLLLLYFGFNTNFQYLIITTFFSLVIIFRNGTAEDLLIIGLYLVSGIAGTLFIYAAEDPIVTLSKADFEAGRLISFAMNTSLAIMVSVIFFKSSHRRLSATQANLTEVSKVATILNTISENMNDGIFKTHPDRGFVYVNSAFAEIFGYDSVEDLMHEPAERLYPSVVDRNELVDEIHARGGVNNRLVHYKKKDDSLFWGRLSCKVVLEGSEEYFVGTVTDVSTQQEHDSMLKESEDQLREAQKIAKIGNWQLFNTSRILRWSEECMRIHGFDSLQTDHDLKDWLARLDNLDESSIDTLMAKAMMTNGEVEFNSWYTTPDDERKYLVYITRYQRSEKVKGGVWYGTVQDYTEQKLAEIRLVETKQFYESWIDKLPIESVIFDEQKRFVYISKSAVSDSKLRAWLIGKTNMDYVKYRGISEDLAHTRNRVLDEAMEQNQVVSWQESMTRENGDKSYHLRFLFPMEIMESRKTKRVIVGYSFNINEIKKAQIELETKNQELTELNKELDRFVYSISHDLRAPIASVLGLINLAKDSITPEELEDLFAMQSDSLERLDQYIKDVIDYSRNKRLAVEHQTMNIGETVDKCLSELRYFTNASSKVKVEIDLQANEIETDPMRFRIIVNNLISNALKYRDVSKDMSWVSISSHMEGNHLILEISDNGIGIEPQYLKSIWDMFFRGTSEYPGSGLGLYILKESASALGAEVEVESELDQGSKFRITFPASKKSVSSDRPSVSSSQLMD